MYNNNNSNGEISLLGIFSTFLGVLNYEQNLQQVSNDELKQILDKHTLEIIDYIKKTESVIIENQNEILRLLKKEDKT